MKTCNVVLVFKSVVEILWCDHSNETSSGVLLHGATCFSIFYKMKFGIYMDFHLWHSWKLKGFNPLSSDAPSCARKQNPSEIPMRPHAPCHI